MDEFYFTLDEYRAKFKDIFPSEQYSLPLDEAIEFMNECIKLNKKATILRPLLKDVIY